MRSIWVKESNGMLSPSKLPSCAFRGLILTFSTPGPTLKFVPGRGILLVHCKA